jgi:3-deoxy-D-manno-octulosonate 8-phosphate phosphatase (KDO 8-P phosphatase)
MNRTQKSPQAFKDACLNIKMLLFDCDGVLTDGRIILGSSGMEVKCFSTTDGMGLKLWRTAGFLSGSITGRSSDALSKRAEELKFDELHQGIARKGSILEEILHRRGLKADEVAYIGDDVNDLPVGARVGLFFVPANHHPVIRPYADYILDSSGGHGVIRETVDIILNHKGLMEGLVADFLND